MIRINKFRLAVNLFAAFSICTLAACGSLVIENVDYSQPIESVLDVQDDGNVSDISTGLSFNVKPLQYVETEDTSSVTTPEVRVIRSQDGYYFVTAPGFSNVFVLQPNAGELQLHETILIDEAGVANPAFNQRSPVIELLDGTDRVFRLTSEGIEEDQS
ncbi:MAG: hypothetical protein WD491_05870 [Balneolales bacterium]